MPEIGSLWNENHVWQCFYFRIAEASAVRQSVISPIEFTVNKT